MGAIFMGRVRNYGLASGIVMVLEARLSEVSVWKTEEGLVFLGKTEGRMLQRFADDLKKDLAKISVVDFFSWFNEY